MKPTPQDLINAAREWLGVPFHHQGRVKAGVDCAGVIVVPAQSIGIELIDKLGYSHTPSGVLQSEIAKQLNRVKFQDLQVGDVALMSWSEPQHLALVTCVEPLTIIHAFSQAKKVVEHQVDPNMIKNIIAVYRFKEFC